MTQPDSQGQARAIQQALRNSALAPNQVDYCNAHGTATRVGDVVECQALRWVWGPDIARMRVELGRSRCMASARCSGSARGGNYCHGAAPSAGAADNRLRQQDSDCAVRLVRDQGDEVPTMQAAISNSFAFGGTNVVLAFKRPH
jgi:3-oxoacyl-[acyl-carrier-protein] synthase II